MSFTAPLVVCAATVQGISCGAANGKSVPTPAGCSGANRPLSSPTVIRWLDTWTLAVQFVGVTTCIIIAGAQQLIDLVLSSHHTPRIRLKKILYPED